MTIEERIQELRKSKGLSQEQLAEALDVSRQAVSKWESGQSFPEIEKLISMSELFSVSIDFILKGEAPDAPCEQDQSPKLAAQVVSAVAAMLLAVAIFASLGRLSDGTSTMDIYGGLVIESVGVMLVLIGWFLAGGRALSKPLFTANVLLAGVLPSLLIAQLLFRADPGAAPAFSPAFLLVLLCVYIVLCGIPLYFAVIRRRD